MTQPSLFDVGNINMRQFDPVPAAAEGASAYTHGAYNPAGIDNAMAKPIRGYRVAQAYKQAGGGSEHSGIRRSYAAMRGDVNRQHEFMTRSKEQGGMGLTHEVVDHDPYTNASQMAEDVRGGRIRTMATAATGSHAFFSDNDNDKFRAVHDVFGHASTGRGFDRNGEEAAFLSHRQMFGKRAIPALASETRGQNSLLNYGGGRFPDQSQKLIGLPAFGNRK